MQSGRALRSHREAGGEKLTGESYAMVIQQRSTRVDEFLLRVIFPWLAELNIRPLMRLARIWSREIPAQPLQAQWSAELPSSAPVFQGIAH